MSCFGCFDTPEYDSMPQDLKKPVDTTATAMISVEVIAPAGKLGVVFKGEDVGTGHTVHKVREGSSMAGQLLPGDMVVSVNDTDTSAYDHDQMAALLSSMSDQERKMIVMRPAH